MVDLLADGTSFDPTIPSKVVVPPLAGNALNPLDMMNQILDLRTKSLLLSAKHRAGQIMAAAPSIEQGIQDLSKDPLTAGMAPEIIATYQNIQQSVIATHGLQQEQGIQGLNSVLQGLFPGISDPTHLGDAIAMHSAVLSPEAQDAVRKAVPDLTKVLTSDLPEGQAGVDELTRRIASIYVGAGGSPENVRAVTGAMTPQTVQTTGPEGEAVTKIIGGPMAGAGAPAGTEIGKGPSILKQAEASATGGTVGNLTADMSADAEQIPQTLKQLDLMAQALKSFQSGGFADFRAEGGKLLQGLKNIGVTGVSQDLIDKVANGDLAASQTFSSQIKIMAVRALRDASQGLGKATKNEIDSFLQMADVTTDPASLLNLLNLARYSLQIGYDKSQKFVKFKQMVAKNDPAVQGLSIADFEPWYASQFDPSTLPSSTGGGLDLGAVQPEEVKGTSEASPATTSAGTGKKSLSDIFGG